ncbi:beta-ketoacyl synthase chain length factor [Carboxylicivirga sp. A043]|uniref:beta-ketoacyl synthase chain length factor n=1 Tax=Carboxylicivirga litoralis TaxID=2816963 RepID=UPI0021CB94D5|nr:beta-ketoacyl synthase chain length factor [Carboxylicivirga sp. A043]MCU4154369.1 beta-ketoacyl synthase chain length factor [Carboxylicivirga sp. A043]
MKLYIKSSDCISAQATFESALPAELSLPENGGLTCLKPDYKKFISPKLLRRMSPIIRNGVTCSLSTLKQANIEVPDAIIVGTALGCLKDTASFLTQLIEENEELPNPTHFIQSTHNTIAGQLALLLKCTNYNFTFSQMHNSFECALLDAQLMLLDEQANNVLVGGVDELPEVSYELTKDLDCYKEATLGEGGSFFVLSTEESSVELKGVKIINSPDCNIEEELKHFNLSINDVDVVIGGDVAENDATYSAFQHKFEGKPYVWYKPFMGEFGTASSMALWIASKIIEEQTIPQCWLKSGMDFNNYNNVVIYNNVGGEQSLIVLSKN